jgi:hypothetical protein
MKEFDDYLKAQNDIFDYFCYNGPAGDIGDGREYNWYISGDRRDYLTK